MSNAIVIFGSGSYVLGDSFGPAPVLRGVLQWARRQEPSLAVAVHLVCRSPDKWAAVTEQALKAADEVGGRPFLTIIDLDDAFSLLRQGALAAFVCVPDDAHADYLNRAIGAGCPAWVVKPLTGDLASATALFDRNAKSPANIWVDYHKRFDQSNAYMRKAVDERRYGDALHYAVQYTQPRSLPLDVFTWSKATDVFTYIGCHYVDQLDFLFPGVAIEKVSALGLAGEVHAALGGRAYDVVVAQLVCRTAAGRSLLATLQVGWCDPAGTPGKSHQRVEMTFTRGRIIADQKARGLQVWDDDRLNEVNPYFFASRLDPADQRLVFDGYGIESINRFLDWCAAPPEQQAAWRRSPSLPWIERSAFTEQVLDMVRRSLDAEGAWIAA